MANVVLGIGTGHASTLGSRPDQVKKIAERDEHDPRIDYAALLKAAPPDVPEKITEDALEHYYELCLRGVAGLKAVLDESAPDVVIVIGDDQHEQFLDDGLPMLALFNGEVMHIVRRTRPWDDPQKGWDAQDTRTEFPGHPELANHLLRSLCSKGFDLARSNALRPNVGLGHAFVNPYRRYFPDRSIPMIPFMVNTYFPPNQPTPDRCYALGLALREAIDEWRSDARVCVMGSGGLSHSVVNEDLDKQVLDALQRQDGESLRALKPEQLTGGTSEIRNWIIAAAAVEDLKPTTLDYVPYYRSPAGTGCGGGFAYWL